MTVPWVVGYLGKYKSADVRTNRSEKLLSNTYVPGDGVGSANGDGVCNVGEVDGVASEVASGRGVGVDHGDEGGSSAGKERVLHRERRWVLFVC